MTTPNITIAEGLKATGNYDGIDIISIITDFLPIVLKCLNRDPKTAALAAYNATTDTYNSREVRRMSRLLWLHHPNLSLAQRVEIVDAIFDEARLADETVIKAYCEKVLK